MTTQSRPGQNPIRIAMLARIVFPLHGFGGLESHVYHLVTQLERLGVAVRLYVQDTSRHASPSADQQSAFRDIISGLTSVVFLRYDHTSPWLPPNGIVGRQINYPWYSWRLGLAAAAAARRGEIDLIHSQGLCATGYGFIRVRDRLLQQVPFVANPHGMEEFRTPDWRKWLAYTAFRQLYAYGHRCADRVIATDACTRDDLPRYLGVDPARVTVIPSAIDVAACRQFVSDDLRHALRARFHLHEAAPVLLSVGRLEQNKGYHILIAALARMRDVLPPGWRWLLVGRGTEEQRLQQLAHTAGIANHVVFAGRLNDTELHSLYEEVDLVVHPTLYEGSSLVTLEAMVHRKPIIASAIGGIPDKVFNAQNGYLVQPGNVADLAAKLLLALEQRDRWTAWGAESMRIVTTTFDWPVVARRTRDLYEELLNV